MLPRPEICVLPWISLEATAAGTIRTCCLSLDEVSHRGRMLTVADGLSAAYHSDSVQKLRQDFLAGVRSSACQRCWNEEDAGRTSKRQWNNLKFTKHIEHINWHNPSHDQLWFLDLKLGNICNLKCRICGTWSSSKWAQEEMTFQNPVNPKDSRAYQEIKLGEWPRKTNEFWTDLQTLLPNVKYFEFTGGEPFLIKEHVDLLQIAVDHGYARDISIHYNTNGTVWDLDLVKIWTQFKHVEIAFSVDNIGKKFELERAGAVWNEVCGNISRATQLRSSSHNISLQVCITVNIQNVFYLEEICKWADAQEFNSIYFNMLHDPVRMNIGRMTASAKQLVLDQLRTAKFHARFHKDIAGIIGFIENGAGSDGQEFCEFMARTDAVRKEKFTDTHAEIAKAMGYEQT
jgi:MoaA/NifB/PqqE/SkfB family radical SAM enzyme